MERERCDACGFDGEQYDDSALLDALEGLGGRWAALIESCGAELRIRPEPEVWSAIEYAAHSRDIIALHAFGVEQALTVIEPAFPEIMADELIQSAATTYADADSGEVVNALDAQAKRLARLARDAPTECWDRGLTIGEFRTDVRGLLTHALHDSLHHVDDVERGLVILRSR